jgi:hypothetical protein
MAKKKLVLLRSLFVLVVCYCPVFVPTELKRSLTIRLKVRKRVKIWSDD